MKVKANRAERAQKNAAEFNVKIPTEINALDNHMFHVVSISQINNVTLKRYDTSIKVKKFHKSEWEKKPGKKGGLSLPEMLNKLGESNLFVFHDPNLDSEMIDEGSNKTVQEELEKAKKAQEAKDAKAKEDAKTSKTSETPKDGKEEYTAGQLVKLIKDSKTIEEATEWAKMSTAKSVANEFQAKVSELEKK